MSDEISDDVIMEARALLINSDWPKMTRSDMENALPVVAEAIAGERERCARLVENPNRSAMGINEDALQFFTEALARIIRDGKYDAPANHRAPDRGH